MHRGEVSVKIRLGTVVEELRDKISTECATAVLLRCEFKSYGNAQRDSQTCGVNQRQKRERF